MASLYDLLLFVLIGLVIIFLGIDNYGRSKKLKKEKLAEQAREKKRKELLAAYESGEMKSFQSHYLVAGTALEESYSYMIYIVERLHKEYGSRVDVDYVYDIWLEVKKSCQK